MSGWRTAQAGLPASVERHEGLGLAVLRLQQPLHYYSAWSFAIGCDTVLTELPWQRYELESRCEFSLAAQYHEAWLLGCGTATLFHTSPAGRLRLCDSGRTICLQLVLLVYNLSAPAADTQFIDLHSRPVQARKVSAWDSLGRRRHALLLAPAAPSLPCQS